MSQPQKTQKIEELAQKLSELKEQRNGTNAEAAEWAEKRDKLNRQVKSLAIEIHRLKGERDKLNEKVKELKQQREKTKIEIREKIKQIKQLKEEIRALSKKKPSRSLQTLKKEVDDIEWKIQTTPLGLPEEKELVEKVKQLETQLNIHRKLDQLSLKIREFEREIKARKTNSKFCHEKLTEDAQRSQEIHERMLEKIVESKKLKLEADNFHKLFLQIRERIRPIQNEIKEISSQMKLLRDEIRAQEETEKKQSEKSFREKLEKQAKEKLKRGEKLSWEEFQLLAEKGITAQD